jgi:hypothetical protein
MIAAEAIGITTAKAAFSAPISKTAAISVSERLRYRCSA